jgi:rRNA maturation RNase YbeY
MLESEDQPPAEISVLIADAGEIRRLNREFRKVDSATDVLSFPVTDAPDLSNYRVLGDIVISIDAATEGASARGTSLETELACLAVHGALHLIGYDDETEPERAMMVAKMNSAVRDAGMQPKEDWASLPH